MPILNYTTKVPVDKTVHEIHKALAKAGASAVMNEYDAKGISGLKFKISTSQGEAFYNMPIDIAGVSSALRADREYRNDDHARRVAWRIVKDWIEAQMAMIAANQAKLDQIFLPYVQTNNGQPLYERIKSEGLSMIGGPK